MKTDSLEFQGRFADLIRAYLKVIGTPMPPDVADVIDKLIAIVDGDIELTSVVTESDDGTILSSSTFRSEVWNYTSTMDYSSFVDGIKMALGILPLPEEEILVGIAQIDAVDPFKTFALLKAILKGDA